MKPEEINLSAGDRKLILEKGDRDQECEIGIQIGMQFERARVVTLIDEDLLGLRARILAGHQEVNK